jgi:RNA polymerase sigma-70 factor (ECF subfamily)
VDGTRHARKVGMCTSAIESQPGRQQVWLAAARRGDHEAFRTLVSPHTPKLQSLARRLTRSAEDAEDVCQESLLKAFTKIDQFDGTRVEIDEFRAWLMRITTNCAIDFLRRKKAGRYVPLEDGEALSDWQGTKRGWGENPEASYTRQEQIRFVEDALSQLPAELRIVCLFRNVRELSTKETAARLGISTIAVRLRLFRAHGQLRKMLSRRIHHRDGPGTPQCLAAHGKTAASLN